MSITDLGDYEHQVRVQLGSSSSKVDQAGLISACETAVKELKWAIPISDSDKEFWLIERAKRHSLYILLIESAHKFKFKHMSLQHRFDHYKWLITDMDTKFRTALEEEISLFGGDVVGFGDFLNAGFSYDVFGTDTTYLE